MTAGVSQALLRSRGAVGQFFGFEVLLAADVSDGEIECAASSRQVQLNE